MAHGQQSHHFRATRFTLNPDHVALRSFVPDDITDGAIVKDIRTQKQGVWHAGRVVDANGNVLCTSEAFVQSKNERQTHN
jgi:hypothetical protein